MLTQATSQGADTPASTPERGDAEQSGGLNRSRASRFGSTVLAAGFLVFGFALGQLTGFSISLGVSQILLTSVFTFVGGVLLSYAGFRKLGSGAIPDSFRVGLALGCFSLGLMAGTPFGVYLRCNKQMHSAFLGEAVEHSPCLVTQAKGPDVAPTVAPPSPNIAATMVVLSTECKTSVKELSVAIGKNDSEQDLYRRLSTVITTCGLPRQ